MRNNLAKVMESLRFLFTNLRYGLSAFRNQRDGMDVFALMRDAFKPYQVSQQETFCALTPFSRKVESDKGTSYFRYAPRFFDSFDYEFVMRRVGLIDHNF